MDLLSQIRLISTRQKLLPHCRLERNTLPESDRRRFPPVQFESRHELTPQPYEALHFEIPIGSPSRFHKMELPRLHSRPANSSHRRHTAVPFERQPSFPLLSLSVGMLNITNEDSRVGLKRWACSKIIRADTHGPPFRFWVFERLSRRFRRLQ